MNAPPLSFDGISAGYPGRPVLHDVTVAFGAGAVTGRVGPNGAGKTTLLRLAVRLLPPTAGAVRVLGRPLAEWSGEALARAVAYLPQSGEAHWPIEARRLVALGRFPHRPAFAPLAPADDAAVSEALARCDAEHLARRRMDELSAGESARVLLARALAVAAPILLVDEPAAHLDPAHQLRLMELLLAEAGRGTAVVVTLHDLSLASRYCDEVVVLHEGRVAAHGPAATALTDETLAAVFSVKARRAGEALIPWQSV
jgi:iron complex transport system ATP-binding protein